MPTYFNPLRRKIGVGTLLMACVLTAGWIRSFAARESTLFLSDNDTTNRLVSFNGNFAWERLHQEGTRRLSRVEFSQAEVILEYDKQRVLELKWSILGFGQGAYRSELLDRFKTSNPLLPFDSLTQSVWILPYWSIVVPLTLLSAWLLLSKPRSGFNRVSCHFVSEHES